MRFDILQNLIEKYNIPSNVKLLSDSGWECDATEMDGIWYNREQNIIIFTQGDWTEGDYFMPDDYGHQHPLKCLYRQPRTLQQAMIQRNVPISCNLCVNKHECNSDSNESARNCPDLQISVEDICKYKLYNTESEKNEYETECGY